MDCEGFGSVRFKPTCPCHPLHPWQAAQDWNHLLWPPCTAPGLLLGLSGGVCGALTRPCWLPETLHRAIGAGMSFPLPPAWCRALLTLLTGPRGRGGLKAARAFLPLTSDRDRRPRGSGSSARQTSLPSDCGGASEQMLFPHHLCHRPALSIPEIQVLPLTNFPIGYSHHQLQASTLAG